MLFCNTYAAVAVALGQLAEEPGPTGAEASGLLNKLSTFECLFALTIAHKVFAITEQLGTLLQSSSMTLSASREGVCNVVHTLKALRSDENFIAVWEDVRKMAEKLNLTPAQLPRKWQPLHRIDEGEVAHNFADCVAYHRVESWFAFLDVIVQQIKDRFSK